MYDVVALGELLIDFLQKGVSASGSPNFEANPGGAPCNLLACISALGGKTAFIGKVGRDIFGSQLKNAIESVGIDAGGLVFSGAEPTTLAFVKIHEDGDREFSFYRNNSADTQLRVDEVDMNLIRQGKIFHFGSLSLTHKPAERATKAAVTEAKQNDLIVSFDPNLRAGLWSSLDFAGKQIQWGLSQADAVKISDEELVFVTGEKDLEKGRRALAEEHPNISLLLVTCGKSGSYAFCGENTAFCEASSHKAIDTTGAGDTFFGACLYQLLEMGYCRSSLKNLSHEEMCRMLKRANTAAGIITTRNGALSVMPSESEISEAMKG